MRAGEAGVGGGLVVCRLDPEQTGWHQGLLFSNAVRPYLLESLVLRSSRPVVCKSPGRLISSATDHGT